MQAVKKNLCLAVAAAALTVATGAAQAAIVWSWSFNGGAEAGQFTTNGNLSDLAGQFNFVVDTSTFTMTSSSFAPGLVGAVFNEGSQPVVGFLWDGSAPTQFYRSNGAFTNGLNVYSGSYQVVFGISGSPVGVIRDTSVGSAPTRFSPLTLTPPSPGTNATVPTPATLWLTLPALLGLAVFRPRRAQR